METRSGKKLAEADTSGQPIVDSTTRAAESHAGPSRLSPPLARCSRAPSPIYARGSRTPSPLYARGSRAPSPWSLRSSRAPSRLYSAISKTPSPRRSTRTTRAPSPALSRASVASSTASRRQRPPTAMDNAASRVAELRLEADLLELRTKLTKEKIRQDEASVERTMSKLLARQTVRDLPAFSGDALEWPLFYSQFKATNEICHYSEAENVARLMKCLKGKARESVSALLVSATGLDKIISTLKLRFGRQDHLIEIMLCKIRSINNIRHDDINGLIEYATSVQNIVAAMTLTDETGHLTNTTLIREIISKLPSILQYQWSFYIYDHNYGRQVTLQTVSDWLMKTANAATNIAPITAMPYEKPSRWMESQAAARRPYKPAEKQSRQISSVLTVNQHSNSKSTASKCVMCENNHLIEDCPDFRTLTIDARWEYVTTKKLCFSCLSPRHQMSQCRNKKKCKCCDRLHHSLLHAEPRKPDPEPSTAAAVVTHTDNTLTGEVLLKVAGVMISGPLGSERVLALCDEGATVSLIDEDLARRIGASGAASDLRIKGVSGMQTTTSGSQRVDLRIRGIKTKDSYDIIVNTIPNLALPMYRHNLGRLSCNNKLIKHFLDDLGTTDDLNERRPLLLIGQDNIDLIVTRQLYTGHKCKDSLYVSSTRLGHIVHGRVSNVVPNDISVLHLCACDELNDAVRRSFSTEGFGTKPHPDVPRSKNDLRALDILEKTSKLVGDRWETGLLWKNDEPNLPDSYDLSRKRLDGIKRKMCKLPDFAARYSEKVKENLEKGYISKLNDKDVAVRTGKTWFLPHFAVFNPNKPDKLRLVLDCAAKSSGKSLNDHLLSGPDFLTSLPGVLLAFRCHKVAVVGDIQEMFHRVLIREEDRQAQRLLWVDGEYVMNVMTFGAVCSPASAQYIKNRNARRFENTIPKAVKAIVDHHYVDDYIHSIDSIEEAIKTVKDVINIHAAGGFNMRNFMSNSKELLRHLPDDKLAPGGMKFLTDCEDRQLERVLGVNWDPEADNFAFSMKFHRVDEKLQSGAKRPCKREVLRLIMSVFDPLGFLLTTTIKARLILQDIWRDDIGWDDEIGTSHYARWKVWLNELEQAKDVRIPRWLMTESCLKGENVQLHLFCDASSRAFSTVAYLRLPLHDGWHLAFVMARGRVAPIKTMSIPRLELQAAVMGARLSRVLREHVTLDVPMTTTLWTDSKTVLAWVSSDTGRFKPFVAHRVAEITDLTDVRDWRWVPTDLNPADDATRDTDAINKNRWLSGPDFLRQPEESWPRTNSEATVDLDDVEVKLVCQVTVQTKLALPDINRFSKYWRYVRTVAWLRRYMTNVKLKRLGSQCTGELTSHEIEAAERLCAAESQQRCFAEDIALLSRTHTVGNGSRLRQLTPYLDSDGLLRARGRTEAAVALTDEAKHPIILYPKDRYTRLLVGQQHQDQAHMNREEVHLNLRRRFWIIDGRNAVKAASNDCQVCKNNRAKPCPPLMGQLPAVRVTPAGRVFTHTGIDYFGPITVKIGRRQEKRYGVLFTCLTVRAIHIEIVSDLTTTSALMALRRFIARRGCPKTIWSDNATTFRGADRELVQAVRAIDRDELIRYGSMRRIEWTFIPPASPHMGGCWERMVRAVKTALKSSLKTRVPREDTLATVLTEAEAIVNGRPLTYVPLDHTDDLPLTPNDFLLPMTDRTGMTTTFGTFTDGDLLRRSWRESQKLADLVWKRWVTEYLPTLTRRDKWYRTTAPLVEGDVVVIADNQSPRNLWPRGIITKTYPGRDGQVRVADVRTKQGLYQRPVTKLCRLDIRPPASTDQAGSDSA
jgi:hypothetical protein